MSVALETPPNSITNEEGKFWERAMTTAQIRQHSQNWSLADDAALLNYLQEFSQKLISRTHEMEKSIDGLVQNAKVTTVHVNNVINDFHMISNSQFIENRVYDEESPEQEIPDVKQPEKSKEELEQELVPRISQALKFGLSMVQENFNTIQVRREDSDSEEEDKMTPLKGETILEVKDSYQFRPLPYIIGTPEFHKDDLVGLSYLLSDDEDLEEEDEEETEDDVIKKVPSPPSLTPQINGHLSSSGEEEMFAQADKIKEPHRRGSESSESLFEEETTKKTKATDGDLFKPALYDEEEEEFSPFGKKDSLFRPKGTLVDTAENEEEGLYGNNSATNGDIVRGNINHKNDAHNIEESRSRVASTHSKKIPNNGRPLLGGGNLFGPPSPIEEPIFKPPPSTLKPSHEKGGLFDSDEEADDLFGPSTLTKKEREPSIFEEPETSKDTPKSADTPKLPPGAVSALGAAFTSELGAALLKKQGKPSTAVTADASEVGSGGSTPSVTKRGGGSSSQSSNSLFTEEQEEHAVIPSRTKSKSLFDDEETEEEADLFTTSKLSSSRKTSVLSISSGNAPAPDLAPKDPPLTPKKEEKPPRKVSLFDGYDDDEDDDLFNFSSKNSTRKSSLSTPVTTKPSNNLFDDIEEEDSLFALPKPLKEEKSVKPQPSKTYPSKPMLKADDDKGAKNFDNDSSKQDDGEKINKPTSVKESPKKIVGGVALFGGIDPLAGRKPALPRKEDAEESPSKKIAPSLPQEASTFEANRPTTLSPLKSKPSLFDSDDFDDDTTLFSAPSTITKPKNEAGLFNSRPKASLFSDDEDEKPSSESSLLLSKSQNVSLSSEKDDLFSKSNDDEVAKLFPGKKSSKPELSLFPDNKDTNTESKIPKGNASSQITNIFTESTNAKEKSPITKNLGDNKRDEKVGSKSLLETSSAKEKQELFSKSDDYTLQDDLFTDNVESIGQSGKVKQITNAEVKPSVISNSTALISESNSLDKSSHSKGNDAIPPKEEEPRMNKSPESYANKSTTSSPLGPSPIKVLPTLVDGKLSLGRPKDMSMASQAEKAPSGPSSSESPSKEATNSSLISFDKPADTSCQLASMGKDRAHGQKARRPPTRRGRQTAMMQPSPSTEEEDLLSPLSLPPTSQEDLPPASQDLFASGEPTPSSNASIFDAIPSTSLPSQSTNFKPEPPPLDLPEHQDEDDDLFGPPKRSLSILKETSPLPTIPKQTSLSLKKEDLDSSILSSSSTKLHKVVDLFSDDNEDVENSSFSPQIIAKPPNSKTENAPPPKKLDLFNDSDETDIISSKPLPPPLVKGTSRSASIISGNKDIFAMNDDDSDDDLFNDSTNPIVPSKKVDNLEKTTRPPVKSISSQSKVSIPGKTSNIFDDDDDDDDIFSKLPSKSSKQISNQFLFDDKLGDIFSDLPSPSSAASKRPATISHKAPTVSSDKKTPEAVPVSDDPLRMGLPET